MARKALALGPLLALLVGCNAVLGIDEREYDPTVDLSDTEGLADADGTVGTLDSSTDSSGPDAPKKDSGGDVARDTSTGADTSVAADTSVDTGTVTDTGGATDTAPPPDTLVVDTAPEAVADTAVACPEKAGKLYGGHCYFRSSLSRNWAEQQAACASTGPKTHLVVITSAGEQAFLEANFTGFPGADNWIGLSRAASDPSTKASFKWVTGEAFSYDNWNGTEPNGSGTSARLTGAYSARWGDHSASDALPGICERE